MYGAATAKQLAASSASASTESKTVAEAAESLLKPLTLTGHTSCVTSVALSADGKFAVSGSEDRTLRVWNLSTGACERMLHSPSTVSIVALIPDDKRVIMGGGYDLPVWNLETGAFERELKGHTNIVMSVALSVDGKRAISGSGDNTLRVWSLEAGVCQRELKGHTGCVHSVALSVDGKRAISGSSDKTLRVWSLDTGICERVLRGHNDPVISVNLSRDGKRAVSGSGRGGLFFNDFSVCVWNLETGAFERELKGHTNIVMSVALSVDGKRAISGSADDTFRVWNLTTGVCETVLNYQTSTRSIALYPHGSHIYALTGLKNGTVDFRHIYFLRSPTVEAKATPAAIVSTLASSAALTDKDKEIEKLKAQLAGQQQREKEKDEAAKAAIELEKQKAHTEVKKAIESAATQQQTLEDTKKALELAQQHSRELEAKIKSDTSKTIGISVNFIIDYSELTFGESIGQGSFGEVFRGKRRAAHVAIKQLTLKNPTQDATEEFKREAEVMAKLNSPDLIRFYGCCLSPKYCLVMEYMPKGSLSALLHSNTPLDWTLRMQMVLEMSRGLAFLHHERIVHRDIKSDNVLLDENLHAKLSDFGLSKVKAQSKSSQYYGGSAGTLGWMAPELTKPQASYTEKSDVYSLGVTFWEIASRKAPFAEVAMPMMIPVWISQSPREELEKIPMDCTPKLGSLITFCWHREQEKRPTAVEIVKYLESSESVYSPTNSSK